MSSYIYTYISIVSVWGTHYPHILQWSAQDYTSGETFTTYVRPKIPITAKAAEITQIAVSPDGHMTHHGKPVDSLSFSQSVERFLHFIGSGDRAGGDTTQNNKCILLAHNGKRFDFLVLFRALDAIGQLDRLLSHVGGFADTIHVIRHKCPGRRSYAEGNLVADILQEDFDAHNAVDDVAYLVKVMKKIGVTPADIATHVFKSNVVFADMNRKDCIETLKVLVAKEICSKSMIDTMATWGLDLEQLKARFTKGGEDGLREMFTERQGDGKPRVTAHKATLNKVIPKLATYLSAD